MPDWKKLFSIIPQTTHTPTPSPTYTKFEGKAVDGLLSAGGLIDEMGILRINARSKSVFSEQEEEAIDAVSKLGHVVDLLEWVEVVSMLIVDS
jgi:3-mercaptopyruvate sulfurtransferase SseA